LFENALVAKGCLPVVRDEQFVLQPDMRAWAPTSDSVWLVIDARSRSSNTFEGTQRMTIRTHVEAEYLARNTIRRT